MRPIETIRFFCKSVVLLLGVAFAMNGLAAEFNLEVKQITHGPKHHFFGYIGHVRTIPWNQSDRYIVALQSAFQDRMPTAEDAVNIVLIDTQRDFAITRVEGSRVWNPQQGTMMYWNPLLAESQFFFNDRDPKTQDVFCVLYDVQAGRRIAEYRFEDTPVGNSWNRNGTQLLVPGIANDSEKTRQLFVISIKQTTKD